MAVITDDVKAGISEGRYLRAFFSAAKRLLNVKNESEKERKRDEKED
jgi:hypothetical protein